MFRQIAAIFIFFAFAAQVFNRSLLVLDYYTNQASYASACENKARPQLHCKGKCQMMKKLKEQEKKEEQNPNRKADGKDEVVYAAPPLRSLPGTLLTAPPTYLPYADSFYPSGISPGVFHPPTIA